MQHATIMVIRIFCRLALDMTERVHPAVNIVVSSPVNTHLG